MDSVKVSQPKIFFAVLGLFLISLVFIILNLKPNKENTKRDISSETLEEQESTDVPESLSDYFQIEDGQITLGTPKTFI
jgi:hypothetical protein